MSTCKYCKREVVSTDEGWVDPKATGDDSIWYYTCEGNPDFPAEHDVAPDEEVSLDALTYFDADGSYGSAHPAYFRVVDTSKWTGMDWWEVSECADNERFGVALRVAAKYAEVTA